MANPNPSPETRFKPGESGNPGGRPAKRKELADRYTADVLEVWLEKGKEALRQLPPEKLAAVAQEQIEKDSQKASIEHKHSGSVEHIGVSETAQWIADTLGRAAEAAPPEPLPH